MYRGHVLKLCDIHVFLFLYTSISKVVMNSLLWQDTFGQILSCIIKSEHPISVHCFLRRLIEFTDLNARFIIRKMLK